MKQKSAKNNIDNTLQNFGLTEASFNNMLLRMKAGNDDLFEKIFLAQFEETIAYLMQRYSVNHSMAYDATMDALLKFRKRLLEGKITYNNMRFLFTQMAGQFLTTVLKKRSKSVKISTNETIVETVDEIDDTTLDFLDAAWKLLGDQCSKLLENYYYKKIALNELAQKLGKSDAALRKQKQRCLETLRSYFLKQYKR
ncbi:sigma70-ECF: RNA polymerase sigma factor, sigma-70 family [Kordia sp. SMS9]|uniref:sigma-70 family RNA polymerase sigma factor n=1 Tax=Kordia sp. SMS9 TaxID=2282170 RepID=UPI000E0DFAB2|nr:sigma-70 family RNA polymerase sigma factor [Kordia sp. SMS9]AXG71589.1 sigma70-ECF: RNA polymerase sigma factor, sigma-70 family [Kordia sp. SMS9]